MNRPGHLRRRSDGRAMADAPTPRKVSTRWSSSILTVTASPGSSAPLSTSYIAPDEPDRMHRFGTQLVAPGAQHHNPLVLLPPVAGGLVIGLMARGDRR